MDQIKPVEVLLIEDNAADVRLIREALRESKIFLNLNVLDSGGDVMDYLRRKGDYTLASRPGLILLDLNLPKKDGRQVLSEIKSDVDLKHIPIVVLTTSASEVDILGSYRDHVNCYITKPVDFNQFCEIVKKISDFWFTIVKLPNSPSNP